MKNLLIVLLIVTAVNPVDAQWIPNGKSLLNNQHSFGRADNPNPSLLIRVKSHDPSFKIFPARSFYKSRRDWRRIIDSTWGPGLPYLSKLQIFDNYATRLQLEFDGFLSLGLAQTSWDSLRNAFRSKITDSTSRGGFAAIMAYFAMAMRDLHTYARDTALLYTSLNPGVPILVLAGYFEVEHFGAVLTALPDSTLLVVRTVANHPLNLLPGDVVIGYEGRPWKTLVRELMDAELPTIGCWAGASSSFGDGLLLGAGMNWHLFDTIDVMKAAGQILHLPVNPLITLPPIPMLNNEQVPIPGIPFPDFFHNQSVSYGIFPNSNVGYIYLFEENGTITDNQFHQAYMALQGTDALIIDMRLNLGGWSFFPETFAMMFNESITTTEDAYRCSPTTFTLCPGGNSAEFTIRGEPTRQWEKPIAVLLGPTCGSMGDVTAQWLRYHDMAKFFGKSSAASMGFNVFTTQFPGWSLRYSVSDMFHVTTPGVYLNRREFPIDHPVWLTQAGVAAGHDAVVDEGLNWVQRVVYAHDVTTDRQWYRKGIDTLHISARIENPEAHQISSRVCLESLSGSVLDSVNLSRSSATKSEQWIAAWPILNIEKTFRLRISTKDLTTGKTMTIRNAQRVFTSGPIDVVGHRLWQTDTLHAGDVVMMQLRVRNMGQTDTLKNVSLKLLPLDSSITCTNLGNTIAALAPGTVDSTNYGFRLIVHPSTPGGSVHALRVQGYSDGWPAWTDTLMLTVHPPIQVAAAKKGALYGVSSNLYTVSRESGTATLVSAIATGQIQGLAVRPTTRELYGASTDNVRTKLYRLASENGVQALAQIVSVPNMRAIAFSRGDTLFGATTTGNLYRIDLASGAATAIGPSTGRAYSGLSFSPRTGKLWASLRQPSNNDSLFTIDRNTGVATFAFKAGWPAVVPSLAFSPEDTLYGILDENGIYLARLSAGGSQIIGETWVSRLDAIAMRTDSGTVSVDEQFLADVPTKFSLELNYPNPFNPTTTIRFTITGSQFTILKVYDMLGREVVTLVNEVKPPGEYSVTWEASGVASGVYFYRLQAGDFVATRKAILMR